MLRLEEMLKEQPREAAPESTVITHPLDQNQTKTKQMAARPRGDLSTNWKTSVFLYLRWSHQPWDPSTSCLACVLLWTRGRCCPVWGCLDQRFCRNMREPGPPSAEVECSSKWNVGLFTSPLYSLLFCIGYLYIYYYSFILIILLHTFTYVTFWMQDFYL